MAKTRPDAGAFTYDPELPHRRMSASGYLLDSIRHRRAGRVIISSLTVLLFLGGSGMFAYPFFTDVYTERYLQEQLADEFAARTETVATSGQPDQVEAGSPLTEIVIPDLDVETLVVEGTSPAALRAGAGHYPNTPLPGEDGNVSIAGHRTTYGKPFNQVDQLEPGDEIWLLTPTGDHRYVVSDPPDGIDQNPWITDPGDWGVTAPTDEASLTLTTCHPKGSAAQRMIVRAELVGSEEPGSFEDARGDAGGDTRDTAEAAEA